MPLFKVYRHAVLGRAAYAKISLPPTGCPRAYVKVIDKYNSTVDNRLGRLPLFMRLLIFLIRPTVMLKDVEHIDHSNGKRVVKMIFNAGGKQHPLSFIQGSNEISGERLANGVQSFVG